MVIHERCRGFVLMMIYYDTAQDVRNGGVELVLVQLAWWLVLIMRGDDGIA
jgi:hypothetical protein